MNKGKLIDADKLKEIICKYYNPKLYEHIFKIIDELSEDREDVVRIKGSEFCNEEPNEYMKFTDWAVREGYTTKVPNSIMNLFIHYLESINKHKKEQPTPLKVAIKGDGTKEYSKVIFQYFSSHTIKGLHDVDSFEQEAYYFIENNELVFSLNLPEGYKEITLKDEEKESNYCTCGNKSNCSTHNGLISVCYDCRKPIKEDRPTGLIPKLEKRVEVIELKLKDLSNG